MGVRQVLQSIGARPFCTVALGSASNKYTQLWWDCSKKVTLPTLTGSYLSKHIWTNYISCQRLGHAPFFFLDPPNAQYILYHSISYRLLISPPPPPRLNAKCQHICCICLCRIFSAKLLDPAPTCVLLLWWSKHMEAQKHCDDLSSLLNECENTLWLQHGCVLLLRVQWNMTVL